MLSHVCNLKMEWNIDIGDGINGDITVYTVYKVGVTSVSDIMSTVTVAPHSKAIQHQEKRRQSNNLYVHSERGESGIM